MAFNSDFDFKDHLEVLRHYLITIVFALGGVFILCFLDQDLFMYIVLWPHRCAMQELNLPLTIQVLRYEESFFSYLKVAFISSLILTTPFIIYQLWLFFSDAFYDNEKHYMNLFFPAALLFFAIGVLFGYYILIPIGLRFLASYGSDLVQIGFTLSSYLSLFFVLTFVAGMTFELPLIMLFFVKIGVFSVEYYIEKWRHSMLIAFILAAILTPPDAVTQLLLAIPMVGLYFLGVLLCIIAEKFQALQALFQNSSTSA